MTPGTETRLAAVLGWPIGHSRSPALHNAAFEAVGLDAVYMAFSVKPAALGDVVRGLAAAGALGVNLTVPHKQAGLALCGQVDPVARAVGAVNTLVFRDGRIEGHNTDVAGFQDSLREAAPDLCEAGGRAVVLGSGGAARAVVAAVRALGFVPDVVARSPADVAGVAARPWTADVLAEVVPGATVLVDATSSGLSAEKENRVPAPVPLVGVPLVASLVYHRDPGLLKRARAAGSRTLDGAGMFVYQAARAFTLFTGEPAPVDVMRRAVVP